jgi:hypothetical protein
MIGTVLASDRAVDPSAARWALSLVGLFLAVFGLLFLSGPGRIDIVDGQVRYEVARSMALYGDSLPADVHLVAVQPALPASFRDPAASSFHRGDRSRR